MKIGIIGLGYCGGSFAKALTAAGHEVFGTDGNEKNLNEALLSRAVSAPLAGQTVSLCEMLLFCAPPKDTVRFLRKYGMQLRLLCSLIVFTDNARSAMRYLLPLREKYGYRFLFSGCPMLFFEGCFSNSNAAIFRGAPLAWIDAEEQETSCPNAVFAAIGFDRFEYWSADGYDNMLTWYEQLPAIEKAVIGGGASLHRIESWIENSDYLDETLKTYIIRLENCRRAIKDNDREALRSYLTAGFSEMKQPDYEKKV